MRYFIISHGCFEEVNSNLYKQWCLSEASNFLLPTYEASISGFQHIIQTLYYGQADYKDLLMPFVIFYSEDNVMSLFYRRNQSDEAVNCRLFYFESFSQYKKKYDELVHMVENKYLACYN